MKDRFNEPTTKAVEIEAMGHKIRITQDPNTKHLGTTVWDSSIVALKCMERHGGKGGEFSRKRVAGKRGIELGAGCGLGGLGLAFLGCDTVLTDEAAVVPLLSSNAERIRSQAASDAARDAYLGDVGRVSVAELSWGDAGHIAAVEPPFDYIVATDVVYATTAIVPLLSTIFLLSHSRTATLLAYEFRCPMVDDRLHAVARQLFDVKRVPPSKLHPEYQHTAISVFILRPSARPTFSEEVLSCMAPALSALRSTGNHNHLPAVVSEQQLARDASGADDVLPEPPPPRQHGVEEEGVVTRGGAVRASSCTGDRPDLADREEDIGARALKQADGVTPMNDYSDEVHASGCAAQCGAVQSGQEGTGDVGSTASNGTGGFSNPTPRCLDHPNRSVPYEGECDINANGGSDTSAVEGSEGWWEGRRMGAMAARLLKDIEVPS